ncbi:unnamed protein product [Orchesella dallaii]|uniref:non-specific serine/threonine protein kinase n=1 Tax=Orchesella dallaii TaxID=48710 RepID=A0ABP1PMB3_9HEXA
MAGKRPPENRDESSSSGDIGHLVVGDEPCTFVKVRDVLYGCASSAKLWPKLLDIASSLQIPTDCIISMKRQINTETITYSRALLEILEAWRGKFSVEAKLQNLINALETNGLTDSADALRIHFNDRYYVYVISTLEKLNSTAKSSTWENLPEHIKHWMNRKPVNFQGNKKKLGELTAIIATPVDEKLLDELAQESAWEEEGYLCLQMELCSKSLTQEIEDGYYLTENETWDLFIDMLLALQHLHTHHLVHMGLKPDNIFLTINSPTIFKLGCFGIVVCLEEQKDVVEFTERDSRYLAPEVMQGKVLTKADVFSLGLTVLELACSVDLPKCGELWHTLRSIVQWEALRLAIF